MIGSTLSRMAAAEKLSIPQLQKAIQDGTLPAYVGIPLLQDKIKQQQQAKAAMAGAQQGGPQPTVADQVMQQAVAEEAQTPAGVDQLPVAAPVTMAGGGIIAFAGGGEAEDEEDFLEQLGMQSSPLPTRTASGLSYADVQGVAPKAAKGVAEYKGITGDHKYKDMIQAEAKKAGLDPEYALKIAMIESGGLKNPEAARSKAGAIGIMQLMPATAKGLGVDPTVPEENIRGGVSMLKRLVDKYGDYELAGAAYNAGEGRVDKLLKSGKGLAGLPSETQGYMTKIRGMAEGGVAHYDDGGITTINPVTGEPYTEEGTTGATADIINFFKRSARQARGLPADVPETPTTFPGGAAAEARRADNAIAKTTPSAIKKQVAPAPAAAPVETAPTFKPEPQAPAPVAAKPSVFEEWMQKQMNNEGKRADQAEQDKWLSVLAAGLGMMGGTSPYAAANIGQGAMAGITNYAAARKQAAAQAAAEDKNILLAKRYEDIGKHEQAQRDVLKENRAEDIALKRQGLAQQAQAQASADLDRKQKAFDLYKKDAEASIEKQYGTLMTPAAQAALQNLYSSPEFVAARNAAFPDLPKISGGTALPQGVIVRQR